MPCEKPPKYRSVAAFEPPTRQATSGRLADVWANTVKGRRARPAAGLYYRQVRRFGAFENAAGINSHLTIRISDIASVAHQPAGLGIFTPRIGRGHRKAHRLKGQLETPAVEEGVAADEEGVGSLARKSRKDPFDLAVCAGVEDLDLQSHGTGSH